MHEEMGCPPPGDPGPWIIHDVPRAVVWSFKTHLILGMVQDKVQTFPLPCMVGMYRPV